VHLFPGDAAEAIQNALGAGEAVDRKKSWEQFWTPPALALNTTYYWQIIERRGAATTAGPVWRFSTRGFGPLHHFDWSAIAPTQRLAQPFAVSLTARDDLDNFLPGFNGNVPISAIAGLTTASSILITEIDTRSPDVVEFQNVSGHSLDISNWKISLYDRGAFTAPRLTVTLPTNTICPPSAVFELVASGKPLGTFPFFYTEASVLWDNVATGWPLAVAEEIAVTAPPTDEELAALAALKAA